MQKILSIPCQRQQFLITHSGKVIHYIMRFSGNGFAGIGCSKTDHGCTGSHSRLQTMKRIFKDVCVFRSSSKYLHP